MLLNQSKISNLIHIEDVSSNRSNERKRLNSTKFDVLLLAVVIHGVLDCYYVYSCSMLLVVEPLSQRVQSCPFSLLTRARLISRVPDAMRGNPYARAHQQATSSLIRRQLNYRHHGTQELTRDHGELRTVQTMTTEPAGHLPPVQWLESGVITGHVKFI